MYANVFELTSCLDDCIAYCDKHPERDHSRFHGPLLRGAKRDLTKSTERADKEFVEWRMESREDRLAWKHLARRVSAIQRKLDAVNAIGYVDQNVNYWDPETLLDVVAEMIRYLREREEDIDFAADEAGQLERLRAKAVSEDDETERALDEYLRFSKMRSDGLTTAKDTIANFRKALRRDLTTRNEDYQAIRWPHQVAPDDRVI